MAYVLFNLETANQEGTFRSEAEALDEVRDAVERIGGEIAKSWALGYWDDADTLHAIAAGDALVDRALERTRARTE